MLKATRTKAILKTTRTKAMLRRKRTAGKENKTIATVKSKENNGNDKRKAKKINRIFY